MIDTGLTPEEYEELKKMMSRDLDTFCNSDRADELIVKSTEEQFSRMLDEVREERLGESFSSVEP